MVAGRKLPASQLNLRRLGLAAITLIAIPTIAYLAARAIASLRQGYSWDEMDWQAKGKTTLSDFFAASEIGRRPTVKNAKECFEYFSYKDGLPVKVTCR